MKPNKTIVFVGAKPDLVNNHAGGQTTASLGLIEYAKNNGIDLKIIDSAQESFPPPSFKQRLSKALNRVTQLICILANEHVSGIIIFSSGGFSFYEKSLLALICKLFKRKSLLFVRSGHFMDQCNSSVIRRTIAKVLLKIPSSIGAQGSNWLDFYQSLGVPKNKVSIIRNWLPPSRCISTDIKEVRAAEELTFLFVGWVVKSKGIFELVSAIDSSECLKKCKVLIAGGGDALDAITVFVKERNLHNVELLGWQSHQEVDGLLKKASVFVLPTYAEGFPNALLEAISQGLPAIITPVGAIPDSAIDGINAELIKPKCVESLRLAMEKFYYNPGLVAKYSSESSRISREFHDRKINCEKLFKLFD
ncbi:MULTISPECIES: glycosyltransferase family 4 protein [unclassified Shewanella]|uniref:glycosyltransferase family 4 protein n=1 Tax=unclassified Shewanella TaxID=196818 RepID=UPI000B49E819|nr:MULTISPECIES: glycosyltransferase family 4 protein [unclassified Shewanella]ASF13681.1 hypothetical protein CEQ32_00505 [Shewanella sp. FDAARGOS_354]